MKTLERLLLFAVLVGLVVISTALAGSAYGGFAGRGSSMLHASEASEADAPQRVFVCRDSGGAVTDCAASSSP